MAASRSIEAKLIISGEDRGASASVAAVVKAVRQMEDLSRVTRSMEQVTRGLQ